MLSISRGPYRIASPSWRTGRTPICRCRCSPKPMAQANCSSTTCWIQRGSNPTSLPRYSRGINDHVQLTVTGLIAACPQSAPCAWCWSPSPGYRPIRTTRAPSMMLPPTVFNRFAVTREINDTAGASICPEPTRVDFDRISGAGSSDSRCIDRSRRRRSLTPGAVEAAFGSASTRLSAYPLLATSPTSSSSQTTQSHLT